MFLITGGAGFIGSHLADALIERGGSVLILDDLSTGRRENIEHAIATGEAEFIHGSALDEALLDECMRSVDVCFHLASTVGVRLVVDQPLDCLIRDVRGADVVTTAAQRHGRRLVFTSTSEVYGKRSDGYVREAEDRLLGPTSTARWNYATAKSFGEALALGYHREHRAEMTVVRMFNTVGPRQTGRYGMVLPRFVSQALTGADLTVYGDGAQSRCFSHVTDAVEGMIAVSECEAALGETLNVGRADEVRISELAEQVVERADSSSKIRFVPYDEAYGEGFEELGCRRPDTSRLRELTGWAPTRTIEDAIEDTIAYQRTMGARQAVG